MVSIRPPSTTVNVRQKKSLYVRPPLLASKQAWFLMLQEPSSSEGAFHAVLKARAKRHHAPRPTQPALVLFSGMQVLVANNSALDGK